MSHQRCLPTGRRNLVALEVAFELAAAIHRIGLQQRGIAHLKDQLYRAADNTVLRLSEANGRTMGNRTVHIEGAYGECQELRSALRLISIRGIAIPETVLRQANRLGGLIYGLLRAERRTDTT
jgi:four helix bundle protein